MNQPIIQNKLPSKLVLMDTFYINLQEYGEKMSLAIEPGFEWDGASIPRVFWITIGSPFNPCFTVAGLVHDYLYKTQPIERSRADKVFHNILKKSGVGLINSTRMYLAVRVGGFIAWKNHKKNLKMSVST
jgi:hypothetical protein